MTVIGSYTIYLWSILFKQVYSLRKQDNSNVQIHDLRGRNISIIILLTTCIESFLYTILTDVLILEGENEKSNLSKRMINELKDKLDKSSWKELTELTNIITGKKLNEYHSNLNWEKIKTMIEIRNKLVHGKNIIKKINNSEEEYKGFYDEIFNRMKQKNWIDAHEKEIFSTTIIDCFIKITEDFIETLIDKLSIQFEFENRDDFIYGKYQRELYYMESLR